MFRLINGKSIYSGKLAKFNVGSDGKAYFKFDTGDEIILAKNIDQYVANALHQARLDGLQNATVNLNTRTVGIDNTSN